MFCWQDYYKNLRRFAFEQNERQMDWEMLYDESYEDEVAILNPAASMDQPADGEGRLQDVRSSSSWDESLLHSVRVTGSESLARSDSEPSRPHLSLPRHTLTEAALSSHHRSRVSQPRRTLTDLGAVSVDTTDSSVSTEGSSKVPASKPHQRRSSRTEKRYHTADSIQELQPVKDSSIHKRLSLNYGPVTSAQHTVMKSVSSDSLRSMPSSSGVSSSGSLLVSTADTDWCDEEHDPHPPPPSDACATNDSSATLTDIGVEDADTVVSPSTRTVSLPSTVTEEDGVVAEERQAKAKHNDVVRIKKHLLLNSTLEAS